MDIDKIKKLKGEGEMIRKKWFIIWVIVALMLGGVAGAGVQETMEVQNPNGELSMLTYIVGDKAYSQIYSGLSISDATRFRKDITVLEGMEIFDLELYINSPGGDAFTGLSMADEIYRAQAKGFKITAVASGIVASAAVPVFASADVRCASPGTLFMVHETSMWKWPGRETASDIRSQNKVIELLREKYLNILADHSKLTADEWGEKEKRTTWFNADEALEWGLVDKIE